MAAQNAALGAIFDQNSACVQRQRGDGRTRAIGGPGGLAWAIGPGRAQGDLLDLAAGELVPVAAAKPAKLQTSAEIARVFSRLAAAFQHEPSNTPISGAHEGRKTAISAEPGRQLPDPLDAALVDAGRARDRAPKLFASIPTRQLQIAISGLYFIRSGAKAVRDGGEALRLFPRYHP